MTPVRLTHAAEADLRDIWQFTAEHWSPSQADAYLLQLAEAFKQLAAHPRLGKDLSSFRPHYRVLVVERHMIYYQRDPLSGIIVSRILHQSAHPWLHFPLQDKD